MRLDAGLLLSALAAAGCSTTGSQEPSCTNESAATPYGDAAVLPLRSLPSGFPCAPGAVCYATIDDCADWPDAASTPASPSVNATPFACECPDGVWICTDQNESPPVCTAPSDAGGD